jgi:hypothetical protein
VDSDVAQRIDLGREDGGGEELYLYDDLCYDGRCRDVDMIDARDQVDVGRRRVLRAKEDLERRRSGILKGDGQDRHTRVGLVLVDFTRRQGRVRVESDGLLARNTLRRPTSTWSRACRTLRSTSGQRRRTTHRSW